MSQYRYICVTLAVSLTTHMIRFSLFFKSSLSSAFHWRFNFTIMFVICITISIIFMIVFFLAASLLYPCHGYQSMSRISRSLFMFFYMMLVIPLSFLLCDRIAREKILIIRLRPCWCHTAHVPVCIYRLHESRDVRCGHCGTNVYLLSHNKLVISSSYF